MLRETVSSFAAGEIAPRAADIDRKNEFPSELWPKLGALGLLGITVEEDYGGTAMGYLAHIVAMEEISRASASVGLSYGAHSNLCVNPIRRNGRRAPALCGPSRSSEFSGGYHAMPVKLNAPVAGELLPVPGVQLGPADAGIKRASRKDVLVVRLDEGATVAGVFTLNRFCAAPVTVAKVHLASGKPVRALVVNTGNANAGTGEQGMAAARALARLHPAVDVHLIKEARLV